ncbi:MAG: sigma 54-interacting transcriptional regulator [Leptospira sp.]|nr:sigma 54-interacting transcriptional regulator [Leptospira sp.]
MKQDISSALRKIQKEIQSLPNITDRLNFILDATLNLFGASTGSISITDQEEKVLTIVAAKGMESEKKMAAKLPFNQGITGRAASSREIVYVPDVLLDKDYIKLIETVRSELAIPFLTRDSTIGVLNLESDKINFFSPEIINQANLFASQLTIVILEERIAKEAFEKSKRDEDPVEEILGYDPALLFLKNRIRQVGPSDTSVMIIGEEGSGKKIVAKALHYISHRRNFPFLTVDCSGLSYELLESELFGSSSGKVFNPGKLELANGGSLYIESIGDLPLKLQERFYNVLKEKSISNPKKQNQTLNIRIFTGNKRDLMDDIRKETFSMDLYYKLAEVPLRLPPLRERRGDIPLLAHHYLAQYNKQYDKNKSFSSEALKALSTMPWSGNIRELQSVIQYAVLVPQETVLEPYSFAQGGKPSVEKQTDVISSLGIIPSDFLSPKEDLSLNIAIEKLEALWIKEAFSRVSTQEEVAKLLGISRGALQYKIKNNKFLASFTT